MWKDQPPICLLEACTFSLWVRAVLLWSDLSALKELHGEEDKHLLTDFPYSFCFLQEIILDWHGGQPADWQLFIRRLRSPGGGQRWPGVAQWNSSGLLGWQAVLVWCQTGRGGECKPGWFWSSNSSTEWCRWGFGVDNYLLLLVHVCVHLSMCMKVTGQLLCYISHITLSFFYYTF